jgi:NodT family efflux transporter outer membrane factor (OMF) lipoprotein
MPAGWTGGDRVVSTRPIGSQPNTEFAELVRWWDVFRDPVLNSLIERALTQNLMLAQAESRVRQARAARVTAASEGFPQVSAGSSASRSRTPGNFGASTGNFFRAGFDASWEIDVFGGTRRSVEAADATIESTVLSREALAVSLVGEIASTYFDLRGSQRQLTIAKQNVDIQQRTLQLTQQRQAVGYITALDVANAQANLAQTESSIPTFDAQSQASIYALATLLGQTPETLVGELNVEQPLPPIPSAVPMGLPSELLVRRSDIRQAESDLHAAVARVGIAIADQYPRFSLTGSFGLQGNQVQSLGTLAKNFWSIGPSVSVPVFTGGRIQGNIAQAREVAEQATLEYRQRVLVALQDVETSLTSFTREQQRREALAESVEANRRAVDLSTQLYNAGRTDFLNVLSAQRQLFSTEAQLAQVDTNVANNLVSLYKALGGGWDPRVGDAVRTPVP